MLRAGEIEDRTFLREANALSVYIIYRGVRYGFPSPEALELTGRTLSDVRVVPDGSLAAIPTVPPDGTLVQEYHTGDLFLIVRGRRLQLDEKAFRSLDRPHSDILGVPFGTLGSIPHAGRYRRWKTGRLAPVVIPASVAIRSAVVRAFRVRLEAFALGVLAGLFVYWLLSR